MTHNIAALQESIRNVAPGQAVKASTVDQSLVLTGSVATAEQAANIVQVANQFVDDPTRVVNQMSVAAPTQVNLQVRIAEVTRDIDRQLGIQWNDLSLGINGGRVGFSGGKAIQPATTRRATGRSAAASRSTWCCRRCRRRGSSTIMAEPNLTARSGESADFLAGGEYPYSTVSDNGTNVQFKNFGIGLNFTPTVMDGNRISLKVATEVSDLDFTNSASVPALKTRRAETTVDLASGQSFAIAGLMSNTSNQDNSQGAGSRDDAGDRRALPLGRLQARADRARGDRDAGDRQPDVAAAGSRPRSTTSSRRTTSSASCSAASRATRARPTRSRTRSAGSG